MDAWPVALFRFDGAGRLVDANAAARRLLGAGPDASLDVLARALDPDGQLPARIADPGPTGQGRSLTQVVAALDGSAPCLELQVADDPETPGGRLVAAHDCTRWHGIESQLQRRLAFERLLTGASAQLIRSTGAALDEAIVAVLGTVGGFFSIDRAYVFLLDEAAGTQSNTHEWVAQGVSREAHNLQDVPLDTFPWLMAQLRADQVFHVDRVADMPAEAVNERKEFEREGIRSILIAPLWGGGALLGFVGFDAVRRPVRWDGHYVVGLRLMAQMFASAIEARTLADRLHHQAFRDPLTGLPNRKLLEDRFAQAAGRVRRSGNGLLVAVVDVDDFKQVNDTHGHAVGDQLLCEVGRRLQGAVRATDTVARMGGDEFVVLAEECVPGAVAHLAERLLAACDAPLRIDGKRLQVGLSIGVARGEAPGDSPDGLLRAADAAMYRAKAEGKQRWVDAAGLAGLSLDADAPQDVAG